MYISVKDIENAAKELAIQNADTSDPMTLVEDALCILRTTCPSFSPGFIFIRRLKKELPAMVRKQKRKLHFKDSK